MTTVDQAKSMSRRLRSALAGREIDVSHSEALELVAQQLGYKNWNTAAAKLGSEVGEPLQRAGISKAHPKVVATAPLEGSKIAKGDILLSVTFDQPVAPGSYSFCKTSDSTFPEVIGTPELSSDGRTYSLPCRVEPGRHYEVWFNRPPHDNFRSLEGAPAEPFQLRFNT